MTAATQIILRRTAQATLSVPVQLALYFALTSLTVWTLLFSSYPTTHDAMHQTRHATLGIGCH